jgi:adenine-specific DNA-methyltransferase
VQYVDPLGTLLGDLPTFRAIFCGEDDRQLAPGQEDELRARLKQVLQRTLRRQAQDFLEKPFVHRQARLFEYPMSPAERSLYDDVTRYLLEPGILAFLGNHRQLLLLGFHRRMASSTRALAASLERVAERLRRMIAGEAAPTDELASFVGDLDDAELPASADALAAPAHATPASLQAELLRVEGYVTRALAVAETDGKFQALQQALDFVKHAAEHGQGADKLVIFTESLVTQEHLRAQLIKSGQLRDEELTLFRGVNDGPRARQALERWQAEVPQDEGTRPSPDIATRLALVHEFKTRSRVLISTEAGAKGLNLQFCNIVVNYDLPWNPQRIEQRIGRCHRYGQRHDVTVINFLAKDNEAQRLTFEILSQKLELFGTVLSASDEVLHRPRGAGGEVLVSALGAEFEGELRHIYERASTIEEVTEELRALRDKVDGERKRFEETHQRTASVIEEKLDTRLRSLFRGFKENLPAALAELDGDLERLVLAHLRAAGIPFTTEQTPEGRLLHAATTPPQTAALGPSATHGSLHLGHPLVLAAVEGARATTHFEPVRLKLPTALKKYRGKHGHLRLVRVTYEGFERVQLLVPVIVLEDGQVLDPELGSQVLRGTFQPGHGEARPLPAALLDDAVEELLFTLQGPVDAAEHLRYERASWQANRFLEDRLLVLARRRASAQRKLEQGELRREGATGAEAREQARASVEAAALQLEALEAKMGSLERREDVTFQRHQRHIEARRYTPPSIEALLELDLDLV